MFTFDSANDQLNISSWITNYCFLMINDSPNRSFFASKTLIWADFVNWIFYRACLKKIRACPFSEATGLSVKSFLGALIMCIDHYSDALKIKHQHFVVDWISKDKMFYKSYIIDHNNIRFCLMMMVLVLTLKPLNTVITIGSCMKIEHRSNMQLLILYSIFCRKMWMHTWKQMMTRLNLH